MNDTTTATCISDAIHTCALEERAAEIEEALDILCEHTRAVDCNVLTKTDVRYNKLHRELCDIYQSLYLRYKELIN